MRSEKELREEITRLESLARVNEQFVNSPFVDEASRFLYKQEMPIIKEHIDRIKWVLEEKFEDEHNVYSMLGLQ